LGIDTGTNSLGWAIIDNEDGVKMTSTEKGCHFLES